MFYHVQHLIGHIINIETVYLEYNFTVLYYYNNFKCYNLFYKTIMPKSETASSVVSFLMGKYDTYCTFFHASLQRNIAGQLRIRNCLNLNFCHINLLLLKFQNIIMR